MDITDYRRLQIIMHILLHVSPGQYALWLQIIPDVGEGIIVTCDMFSGIKVVIQIY